jgi:GNAT superfamily N-acetyltransferase
MQFFPLTPDRWSDLERLFGPKGACSGCWCMWWRISHKEFRQLDGSARKSAFQAIVSGGRIPGILGYQGSEVAGWCSIEPRWLNPGLDHSRICRPIDNIPVWSITCLFIHRNYRRKGLTVALIKAAFEHARRNGATTVESYPLALNRRAWDSELFVGTVAAFERAGFKVVGQPSPARRIMRRHAR